MSESSDLFTWGVRSDVGRVRQMNQDSLHAASGLFVVADGMGGHRGGEVASSVAVDSMASGSGYVESIEELVQRVRDANLAILDRADADSELLGMGTTLCAVAPLERDWEGGTRLGLVNVGDSRIYRFAGGRLEQITEDHSLVATLVRDGHVTAEEAATHPNRNVVTRALGTGPDIEVDYWELRAARDELYLLCSDGLFGEVTDSRIAATLRRLNDPGEVAEELVRLAMEGGARDNVTVVVLRVDAGDSSTNDDLPSAPETSAPSPLRVDSSTTGSGTDREDDAGLDVDESYKPPRPGRVRAALLAVAVFVILGAGIVLIGLYARNSYYVAFDQDQVVVYRGRPDGLLWFDPTVEEPTAVLRTDLTAALELEIEAVPEFGTLTEAENYIENLVARAAGS